MPGYTIGNPDLFHACINRTEGCWEYAEELERVLGHIRAELVREWVNIADPCDGGSWCDEHSRSMVVDTELRRRCVLGVIYDLANLPPAAPSGSPQAVEAQAGEVRTPAPSPVGGHRVVVHLGREDVLIVLTCDDCGWNRTVVGGAAAYRLRMAHEQIPRMNTNTNTKD